MLLYILYKYVLYFKTFRAYMIVLIVFFLSVEWQVHARYGQYAQLYPHRRGTAVPGSYCERTFHGCAPTRCFVQSPGFPGIYPR